MDISKFDSSRLFNPDIETIEDFLERFKLQNRDKLAVKKPADKIGESNHKAMILANSLPVFVLSEIQRRLKPITLTQANYEDLEKRLISSYGVKKSAIGATVNFLTRKQKAGESLETYAKVLNDLAAQCDYKECCRDRMLRDSFISGLTSSKLMSALITDCETKTFSDCVERAKVLNQVVKDVEEINPRAEISLNSVSKHGSNTKKKVTNSANKNYKCIRCGTTGKHTADKCWAIKLRCHNCQKYGHVSKACRSRKQKSHGRKSDEDADNTDYISIHTIFEQLDAENTQDSNDMYASADEEPNERRMPIKKQDRTRGNFLGLDL